MCEKCTSTIFLTSVLDGTGWLKSRSGHVTPGNDPVTTIIREWLGPGPVCMEAENHSSLTCFDPRTAQTIASRYID